MDTRTRRDGREIEILGTYDPMVPETDARAMLNGERIDYWLSVGATPTPKVGTLIKKYGTNGTHLDAQKDALEKLGAKRAAAITAAVSEAEETKVETKSAEDAAAETSENAEAAAEATDAPAEAAEAPAEATDAPAEEAPAEEAPAEEASAEEKKSDE